MPDIWMDVDATLAEVPVNVMPLIDDTDFKSIEGSVVYNQSGLVLIWNFVTTAGVQTETAVTPTTGGGDYDWSDQGSHSYSVGLPASGGASANNDTEGFGWFTGYATGILPWRGPTIGFRASGLNNLLIDSAYSATRGLAGTALPAAAADAAGGLPISDAGGLDLDTMDSNVSDILTDTGTTIPSVLGTPSDFGSGTSTLAANLEDIADNGTASYDRSTDSLQAIRDHVGDGTNLTEAGGDGDHLTAIDLPDQTMNITGNITGNLSGSVGSVTGAVGSVTGAVGSVTGNVGGNVVGSVASVTGNINTAAGTIQTLDALDTAQDSQHSTTQSAVSALNDISVADVLTTQMTEAYAADGAAPTIAQALMMIQQMLGEFAISGTTLTVKKLNGSTTAATFTLNDGTSPTSLTRAS